MTNPNEIVFVENPAIDAILFYKTIIAACGITNNDVKYAVLTELCAMNAMARNPLMMAKS